MSLIDELEDLSSGEPRRGGGSSRSGRRTAVRAVAEQRSAEREQARRDGLGLLPELPAAVPGRGHHRLLGVVAGLLALTLVASVFWGVSAFTQWRREVGSQVSTAAALDPAQRDAFVAAAAAASGAPAGTGASPIVLAYHDIAPDSDSEYVVTPQAFANQMAMLDDAGYTTLTSDQFTAYARGEQAPPPRSVLITFDDSTSGLYTYADRVLADHGFHAVSFVITGFVGTHAPYYLTWRQIERMRGSGRWSFGSHTEVLHVREQVVGKVGAEKGSILTHRRIVGGRQESYPAFTRRVRADLEASITDMTDHGLPRPTLFAWPFSEVTTDAATDPRPLAFTRSEVDRLFTASFANELLAPRPATPQDARDGLVQRLELFRPDTASDLFASMAAMEELPVGDLVPGEAAPAWRQPGGQEAPVVLDGADVAVRAPGESYEEANWAPQRTSTWEGYAVQARVTGLTGPTTAPGTPGRTGANAGLRVRVGRVGEVAVRASTTTWSITRAGQVALSGERALPSAAAEVRLEVTPEQVRVLVDGREVAVVAARPGDLERPADGDEAPGSLGLVVQRSDDPASALPGVADLRAGTLP